MDMCRNTIYIFRFEPSMFKFRAFGLNWVLITDRVSAFKNYFILKNHPM